MRSRESVGRGRVGDDPLSNQLLSMSGMQDRASAGRAARRQADRPLAAKLPALGLRRNAAHDEKFLEVEL